MRAAAIFRALAAIDAGPVGREPQRVGAARDHVDLAAEARDPEAVDDVGRLQDELDGAPDRNADLVRARDHRGVRAA